MDYLFGTSKPKAPVVKVDINAPTLSDTSKQVNSPCVTYLDGCKSQSHLS